MAYVQSTHEASSSNISSPTLTGVTGGNTLIALVSQSTNNNTRTYTAVDDVDGSMGTPPLLYAPGRQVIGYVLHDVTAGSHTVTVTGNDAVTFRVALIEWSGLDPLGTPVVGTYVDPADTTDHYCAAVGEIDTLGAAAVFCVASLHSATGVTSVDPTGDYTELATVTLNFYQYKDAAAALTDDRGYWTSTGTPRVATAGMLALPYPSVSVTPTTYPRITRRRLPGGLL